MLLLSSAGVREGKNLTSRGARRRDQDMVYLSRQGYRVVGVEGVHKAIEEFAQDRVGRPRKKRREGSVSDVRLGLRLAVVLFGNLVLVLSGKPEGRSPCLVIFLTLQTKSVRTFGQSTEASKSPAGPLSKSCPLVWTLVPCLQGCQEGTQILTRPPFPKLLETVVFVFCLMCLLGQSTPSDEKASRIASSPRPSSDCSKDGT